MTETKRQSSPFRPLTPPLYFMLDNNLGIQQWDENVNTLVPFQTVAALEDVAELKMYQGQFLAPGFLKIYFGYRSPDGTVVINGEPIEVEIRE